MSTMWHKVEGVKDIPIGDWVVILDDGKKGYLEARQCANGVLYIVNGYFHFDQRPVVAYSLFPKYDADDFHVEKEDKVIH